MISNDVLAFITQQIINAGIAYCPECSDRITHEDEHIVTTVCPSGHIQIWHAECLPEEDKKEMAHQEARAMWRFN